MKLEDLNKHLNDARKARNTALTGLIGTLIASLTNKDKKGKTPMDKLGETPAILEMLKETRKNNQTNLAGFAAKGGNEKMVAVLTEQNRWIDEVLKTVSNYCIIR